MTTTWCCSSFIGRFNHSNIWADTLNLRYSAKNGACGIYVVVAVGQATIHTGIGIGYSDRFHRSKRQAPLTHVVFHAALFCREKQDVFSGTSPRRVTGKKNMCYWIYNSSSCVSAHFDLVIMSASKPNRHGDVALRCDFLCAGRTTSIKDVCDNQERV